MKRKSASIDKTTATAAPADPAQDTPRLKAERIQDLLKSVPSWTFSTGPAKSLNRVQQFSDARVAACYVQFVTELAMRSRQTVVVSLAEDRVALRLYGETRRGANKGGLTETSFAVAAQIG